MQTVNLLTIALQLGAKNQTVIILSSLFKTRFKIVFWFAGAQFFTI